MIDREIGRDRRRRGRSTTWAVFGTEIDTPV